MRRDRLQRVRGALFGDRAFYGMVLAVLIPIIVQNAITNFVQLLDNIMVGQVGTEQMSGVSIANQLLFVFNLCVFGGLAGAGIFAAQYYGAGSREGVRHCFRYKFLLALGLVAAALVIERFFSAPLIMRYLHDESDPGRVAETLKWGMEYLHVMRWGLILFALTQVYASTLRETGKTRLPMLGGIAATGVNLVFNYLLIFGHLGFPRLGAVGAAWATVLSRAVELAIVAGGTHLRPQRYPFVQGLYRTFRIPGALARDITLKGLPLLINEAFWSVGMTQLTQCYSLRGLDVVAAMNISQTVSNLFAVTIFATGSATAVIVGQALGAGDMEGARRKAWHLIVFAMLLAAATGLILLPTAALIPDVYRTSGHVRRLAAQLLRVYALCMPMIAFANCTYFILRSGGKTGITFLFDSGFTWAVCVPVCWILTHLTGLGVVWVYACVQLTDLFKCALGAAFMLKGLWINNMVNGDLAS